MTQTALESVDAVFRAALDRWAERPMMETLSSVAEIYDIDAGAISYGDADAYVGALAQKLVGAGYGTGMRIGLLLENRPIFFLHWLAFNRIGVSVCPFSPDLRAAELEYQIGHAEPALIVAIAPRIAGLQAAADAAGIKLQVIAPGNVIPAPRENAIVTPHAEDVADHEAAILYTSGTTGQPKGCVLTNTYFTEIADWYTNLGGIATLKDDGERMITPLPIFHMNAMAYSFMAMLSVGGCLIALDRFHPRSWWDDVRKSRATSLHYLGVMPSMLMGRAPTDADRDHSVRFGFGAGVDPKLQAQFETQFGIPLCEAWAMTETGAGAVIAANTEDRLIGQATFGKPNLDLDVLIVDDAGAPCPTGIAGELLVRRKGDDPRRGFFKEYYKNPEATAEAWQNGWFHTGDIVRTDADGNMFFIDRKKNVIRRSGENIAAVEVESILMRHPRVKAAGIAAVPDPVRVDEVFACLLVDDPSPPLAREITQWALGQIAYHKVPGFIAFVESLPLTSTQKIQRAELKELAAELLDHPDTVKLTDLKKRQPV